MTPVLSFGVKALAQLALIAVMLSTVCLLRAAILFTVVATLMAVLPLLVRMSRIRAADKVERSAHFS